MRRENGINYNNNARTGKPPAHTSGAARAGGRRGRGAVMKMNETEALTAYWAAIHDLEEVLESGHKTKQEIINDLKLDDPEYVYTEP